MNQEEIDQLARILWDYHLLNQPVTRADAILVLGSHDPRVADRVVDLFMDDSAPWLIFSGGFGNFTEGVWMKTEAETFAEIAIRRGVPENRILLENRSTNTGENIRFTKELLEREHHDFDNFLLVQKPYMERRTYATFCKQWPGKTATVTSPLIEFEDYPTPDIPFERVVNIMVGDLQRIDLYPGMGFQIHQEIPENVRDAFTMLVGLGFDEHLISPLDSSG